MLLGGKRVHVARLRQVAEVTVGYNINLILVVRTFWQELPSSYRKWRMSSTKFLFLKLEVFLKLRKMCMWKNDVIYSLSKIDDVWLHEFIKQSEL
jgi:hypothetical protein